jgi:hypothetical protein
MRSIRVPFAFHLRSICVPFAFHLRSKCVPFAFHFYWNAPAFRVPVTLVSKPDSVGNHRYFPSINQRYFHILFFNQSENAFPSFFWDAFQPRSGRVPSVRLFLSSTVVLLNVIIITISVRCIPSQENPSPLCAESHVHV